jgi:site-specific DNA-methyltransferase (adenine-specific)
MKLLLGDCIDKLKELDDNSVDSIVTDPPYGLSFMGKKWDYDVPSQEIFEECLRVLKPGGHLLSFAGSRTYHRMAVRVEDAGFEIRDQIMWIYGSGFPKSMNIGKAMDKVQGNERKVIGKQNYSIPKADNTIQASSYGISGGLLKDGKKAERLVPDITKGNSEYEGWGTALKPAHEPIVMARKPLSEKTVVDNVLEWGTGGINVEESRIPYKSKDDMEIRKNTHRETNKLGDGNFGGGKYSQPVESGRFPSNIIFDEEAGKILDEQSGISKSTGGRSGNKEGVGQNGIYGQYSGEVRDENPGLGDIGGASRFFYCPKTSKTDRNEGLEDFEIKQTVGGGGGIGDYQDDVNSASGKFGSEKAPSKNNHPTVKPTDLMLYLIRLVTPKGGTTLDPFMGSGSTGKAATRGGFDFIGIEREKDYMEIAKTRIQYEKDNPYNEEKKERVKINKNANKFF